MVSYDVVSLFTNVPLDESINLAVNIISENEASKINKKDLKKLFQICTSETHFMFNGDYYDQIDGVCMGSPLGPVLANLFMGIKEIEWINDYAGEKPLFYRRYVDDICCVFKDEGQARQFLNYLNAKHANIRFTIECEKDGTLPFLDVKICRSNSSIITSTYYKPTHTGLLTSFTSFVPHIYKKGLVRTLFDRAHKICNTEFLLNNDIKYISNMLQRNLFPRKMIANILEKVRATHNSHQTQQASQTEEPDESDVETRFFKLPFTGNSSDIVANKIRKVVNKFCKKVNVRLIFNVSKTSSFFSVKDRTPNHLLSHVVYLFKCAGCNATYIGETHRHLTTRIEEHSEKDKNSHVFRHLQANPACKTKFEATCFSVIDRAETKFKLEIKEAYHIKKCSPTLNGQIKTHKLNILCA